MTEVIRDSRTLPVSADRAWSVLTDWSRADEWMPGVKDMTADGPTAVGTVLRYTARGGEHRSTVTDLEPARSITLRSQQGGVRADYRYTIDPSPDGGGSTVGLVAEVVVHGPWRVLAPLIRRAIAGADRAQLQRFAAIVEG